MLALPARGGVEAQAKPSEVVENGGLVLRLAPRLIQVFNAQQQASVQSSGELLVEERRIGVAKVQRPVGRGGESQDGRRREQV